jgi:acetolactate synthase I/II/III large subunit
MEVNGAQAIVECIRRESIKHAFCVPGESYLGVIDTLYQHPEITLISNRHEGGAAFAAEAYAKATGKPGVCFVSRGPGASNACIGVHTAYHDSTPMVLFVGQVERLHYYREGFQEVDFEAFFSPITKWAIEIRDVKRIPELVQRAFHVARSGRPGPVAVSLPADMLQDTADMHFADPYPVLTPEPTSQDARQIVGRISEAGKAAIIAGGGVSRSGAQKELVEFSEKTATPVFSAFRRLDVFPNHHPHYLGDLGLGVAPEQKQAVQEADVVLAIGTRLSEVTTQAYTLLSPQQELIHIDIDPSVFGAYKSPRLAVVADARKALQSLLRASEDADLNRTEGRLAWISSNREFYTRFTDPASAYAEDGGYVDTTRVVEETMAALPKDSIITVDAGNFSGWVHRFYQFERPGTFIGPTSGAMGYGMPAALGAKLAHPDRVVVSFSGDGSFMMTVQELETAVRHEIPYISIVVNNNMHGTIRMHQEMQFPGRVHATALTNPDFSKLAEQFGAHGERVEQTEDFAPALRRALTVGKPAVIEVLTNPEQITASATIESLRRIDSEV